MAIVKMKRLRMVGMVSDREELLRWVEIAVAAAAQIWGSAQGEEKKKAVADFLREKGFSFSEREIDSAIEAAVLQLHRELEAA